MPELTDIPFRAQVVSERVNLPLKPQLPPDILDRFPMMREYQEQEQSWWSRTRKLLNQTHEEQSFHLDNFNHNYLNLEERVGENAASIISLAKVVADEDAALSLRIDALSSSIGGGSRTKVFAQPDAPDPGDVTLVEGDLWFDTDDENKVYRWSAGMEWVLLADARIAGAVSAITTITTTYATQAFAEAKKSEAIIAAGAYTDTTTLAAFTALTTAYTSADTTLASRITTLETKVDTPVTGLLARVTTVESTKITLTEADAAISTAIAAEVTNRDAAISSASSALTTAFTTADSALNTALGGRITNLEASVDTPVTGILARVTTIESTYATETFAEAKKSEAISAAAADATAKVATETTARVAEDEALADQIALISATNARTNIYSQPTAPASGPSLVEGDLWFDSDDDFKLHRWSGSAWVEVADGRIATQAALITTIQTTYASDSEVSAAITAALVVAAADATAKVSTESSARITADGNISGKYTLKVAAGNVVTGMNFTSTSGPGTDISSVTFQANNFLIYNGTSGVAMFDVSSSAVRLGSVLTVDTANAKVFIGVGTYGNANTPFYVNSDGDFSLKDKLTFNATTGALTINGGGTFTGTITATGGAFGGWNLGPTTLSNNNAILDSAGQLVLGTASEVIYISATDLTYRLWVGNATASSATFRVTKGGVLTAIGANITGAITATSGSFTGAVTATSGSFSGAISAGAGSSISGTYINNGSISVSKLDFAVVGSTNVVGMINASTEGIRITGNRITLDGNVSFASGYDPTTRLGPGGAAADVNANVTTISGSKIRTGSIESANWNGSTVGSQLDLSAGTLRLGSGFSVTSAGAVTATAATISGTITGSTITGSTLSVGSGITAVGIGTGGITVGNVSISGVSSQNTINISGAYQVSMTGGNASAAFVAQSGANYSALTDLGLRFGTGLDVNLGRGGSNLLLTTNNFQAAGITGTTGTFSGTVTGGRLTTANFDANPGGTAVDVISNNLRVFNGGTQTFRVDYSTGHIYINNNRVVGSRGSRGSAGLTEIVALLDSWNAWG